MSTQYEHKIIRGLMGGVLFENAKPCPRCPVPRVNQETVELNKLDPNTVLARYKAWLDADGGMHTIFGENFLPQSTGVIRVGDEVVALDLRDPPLEYGSVAEMRAKKRS